MNITWHRSLTEDKKKLIFGNETEDSLTKAYDKKRTVHAGGKSTPLTPEDAGREWMKASMQPVSGEKLVYVNVPFCQTRCSYCGFFKNFAKPDMMEAFTNGIVREIEDCARLPHFSTGNINAVYIGGGTPGALDSEQIGRMLGAVRNSLPLANDCEFTFETRTFQLTDEKVDVCLNAGVNRFSIGVQSFDTRIRRAIGRVDDGETVMKNIERLKRINEAAVSIDLMFGLPYQSESDYIEDILTAHSLEVDGMALYQLNVFEDGRMNSQIKDEKLPKPASTAQQALFFLKAHQVMQNLGYLQPSMAHWVRDTRDRSLYNRMSKKGTLMHAFGAGAGGRTHSHGYFTHMALEPYLGMVNAGRKPIMGMSLQADRHRLHSLITYQIDCGFLRLNDLDAEAGFSLSEVFEPLFESWRKRRMITLADRTLKLTPSGQFWYVNMAQSLIDVLEIAYDSEYSPAAGRVAGQN